MRRFQVDALGVQGAKLELDATRSHHLLHVLRLKPGTAVMAYDGVGGEALAIVVESVEGTAVLQQTGDVQRLALVVPLHLLIGVPKKAAMDLSVRMATELGATHIHPVLCARSVAKGNHSDRWQRIAEAAAQQCGRPDLPHVSPLCSLVEALAELPDGIKGRVGVPGASSLPPVDGPAAVLVGPEGGLTEHELRQATDAGFQPVGVARWTLRADTAVAAMLTATTV